MLQRFRGTTKNTLILLTLMIMTLVIMFVFIGSEIANRHAHNEGIIFFLLGILIVLNAANLGLILRRLKKNKAVLPQR